CQHLGQTTARKPRPHRALGDWSWIGTSVQLARRVCERDDPPTSQGRFDLAHAVLDVRVRVRAHTHVIVGALGYSTIVVGTDRDATTNRHLQEVTAMTTEQNKAVVRRFFEAFEADDQTTLNALLAPDLVAYSHGGPGPQNRETHVQGIRMWNAAF